MSSLGPVEPVVVEQPPVLVIHGSGSAAAVDAVAAQVLREHPAGEIHVVAVDGLPVLGGASLGVSAAGVKSFGKVSDLLDEARKTQIHAVLQFVSQYAPTPIANPAENLAGFYYNITQGVVTLYTREGAPQEVDLLKVLYDQEKELVRRDALPVGQQGQGLETLRAQIAGVKNALTQLKTMEVKGYSLADCVVSSQGRSKLQGATSIADTDRGMTNGRKEAALQAALKRSITPLAGGSAFRCNTTVPHVMAHLKQRRNKVRQLLKQLKRDLEQQRAEAHRRDSVDQERERAIALLNKRCEDVQKLEQFFLVAPNQDPGVVDVVDAKVAIALVAKMYKGGSLDERDKKNLVGNLEEYFVSVKTQSIWGRFCGRVGDLVTGVTMTTDPKEKLAAKQLAGGAVGLLFNTEEGPELIKRQAYAQFCLKNGIHPTSSNVADVLFTLEDHFTDQEKAKESLDELGRALDIDMNQSAVPGAQSFNQQLAHIFLTQANQHRV